VLPEQPEVEVLGEAEGFAAGDLGDIDIETPSRTADSVSATAGMSPRRANSLLDNLSRRIVPSWLGWSGRGAVRSDPIAVRHAQQHSRGGSRSTRSVDRVPDSSGVPAHPRMYETPLNANVLPQGQIRQEGAYAAHPGMLFDVPLEPAEEAVYANPTFTVPVSVERDFPGRSAVQVSGSVVSSSSGAGFVGAGQRMPVPTGQAGAAAASAGGSAVGPVQPEFLPGIQSTGLGHSMPNRLSQQAITDGLVYTTTTPMVSAGVGASVGARLPVPMPVDMAGLGMAGFVPPAALSLVNGGFSTPAYGSAVPSVAGGAFPRAGFPESAGAPQGVPGLARGTCPTIGSRVPAPPGGGAPAPGGSGAGTGPASGSQNRKVLLKLMTYDGTGSLETFLAKFSRLAEYMRWDDTDRYYHLCASLDGIAGQVLWDAGPQPTVADVITLLRTRFGNELHAERFKAEIKVRRRRPKETLQQLYQDISKLVALAYPGSKPELSSHVAKEAFVEALNDPQLQLKVIEREPKTVEDALNIAVKMEAYQASVAPPEPDKRATDHRARPKVASAYAVEGTEQTTPAQEDDMALIHKRLSELQAECTNTREEIGRVKAQKEEAEKKAAQATQAAKAAAQAAKSVNPLATAGSASNPGGGGNGHYRPQGSYRGRGRGRGNYQARSDDVCHKCGGQGHWARDCPNGPPPEQPATPPAPAVTKVVDYKAERGWVGAEFRDEPIRCMLDLGIQKAAIGEKFLVDGLWKRGTHHKEYETMVNGKLVHVKGQTMIVFRLASGDCREIMVTQVDITPDLDGLVLRMEWMHENTCMWNIKTGKVHAIDDIVFHAKYDRDASLVSRVTPLPDGATMVGLVSAAEPEHPMGLEKLSPIRVCGVVEEEEPMSLEELLPIQISGIIEPESEGPGAVGMVKTRSDLEGELADPESSMSDATSSPSESDYEDEAESESSDRDRGGTGQPDPPGESTLVPVPVAQFEQMEDTDDPAPVTADPIPEPMIVVPYDPDVIVEQVEEVELEPELASSDEQEQSHRLNELSQGNAMAASATPVDPDRDDTFTREELVAAQQAEEAIRVTIEYCKKGTPPDRDEIRTIPEEAKDMLL